MPVGTLENPLRVAIIGSGPAGFYAADFLLKQKNAVAEVDMFDRLPTPYGLVRGGVAPDHQKIKSVIKVYERIASSPNFRFYGNVELGRDLSYEDFKNHYHQIICAVGAQTDRRMGIEGEDLPGSHSATDFVGWYNGHPDYRDLKFDLTQEKAIIIGNGNVAMDVARILASSIEDLKKSDIAEHALDALRSSRVSEIYIVGRRGPSQSAFTNAEIKELGELPITDIVVNPSDMILDPASEQFLSEHHDAGVERNIDILKEYSTRPKGNKSKKIIVRFLLSPKSIHGKDSVQSMVVERNRLKMNPNGQIAAEGTGQTEILPCGLVFRSIGYKGMPLQGLPFDDKKGVIPNLNGKVFDPESKVTRVGEYVAGWIKRGPSGVIGTNKADALETANGMYEDFQNGKFLSPASPNRNQIEQVLKLMAIRYVRFDEWMKLDQMEQARGAAIGKPREKFVKISDMLDALKS